MASQFLYLFFLSLCVVSCSGQSSHWASREELKPAVNPNIKLIHLDDGTTMIFDKDLGWYNAQQKFIEGVSISGSHDTIPISRVWSVEIKDDNSIDFGDLLKTIGIFILATAIIGLVLGALFVVLFPPHFTHGPPCLVMIAILSLSLTGATILVLV
jgi:hypothetical protein